MSHRVVFAPEAEQQLMESYRYIVREVSPAITERFVGSIIEHCAQK